MNKEEARIRMMDYLYNEMDDNEKAEFEQWLDENPSFKIEMSKLKATRNLLNEVPLEAPSHKLVYLPGEQRQAVNGSMKTLLAAAAVLLVAVLLFAVTTVQIGQTETGFFVTVGQQPAVEGPVSEEAVMGLMEQIREENALLMAAMLEQAREQQNKQLEEVLTQLTNYYDLRREQDLYLIAEGLAQLEEETAYRLYQTNEVLSDVIYALSNE